MKKIQNRKRELIQRLKLHEAAAKLRSVSRPTSKMTHRKRPKGSNKYKKAILKTSNWLFFY